MIFFLFFPQKTGYDISCTLETILRNVKSCFLGKIRKKYFNMSSAENIIQGPVVQSVVSLTSSLRVISLTILADSIYNILIFFAEKKMSSFCSKNVSSLQKLLPFFQQKYSAYLRIT